MFTYGERICAYEKCDNSFVAKSVNAIYCSSLCNRRAYRTRHQEKINREWRVRYAENGYEKHILRKYSLSLEEWKILSRGGCEICRTLENLVVDHDHSTGKVRGCLCVAHNAGIGSFHDSVEEMKLGIQYLEKHE